MEKRFTLGEFPQIEAFLPFLCKLHLCLMYFAIFAKFPLKMAKKFKKRLALYELVSYNELVLKSL